MKEFPTLYRKTSSGKLQYWSIKVVRQPQRGFIITEYGRVGTHSPQVTQDIIKKGKNIGRSNQTTPYVQACHEAQSKWESQKKRGYVESERDAKKGKTDAIIKGGILPMLAANFDSQGHKIKYPCAAQPKYDGHRCIAIVDNGKVTLWSRTRKEYFSVPHIKRALEQRLKGISVIFDGELYIHDLSPKVWKKAGFEGRFEFIGHLVRQKTPHADHKLVEFHIFDIVSSKSQLKRLAQLNLLEQTFKNSDAIWIAKSLPVKSKKDIKRLHKFFVKLHGYEGFMLRNLDAPYKSSSTRSYDLQKVKMMQDAEYKVVGIHEGRGKLKGHVGAFICEAPNGKRFKAKMKGHQSFLKKCFENKKLWHSKMLTVQFQELTGKNGVPRFPVALRFPVTSY